MPIPATHLLMVWLRGFKLGTCSCEAENGEGGTIGVRHVTRVFTQKLAIHLVGVYT
jgi:hypothetical protein